VERINDELGDVLFSIVNLSRFLKVQPELALMGSVNKFIERFEFIEKEAAKSGRTLSEMSLDEMDELWNKQRQKFEKNFICFRKRLCQLAQYSVGTLLVAIIINTIPRAVSGRFRIDQGAKFYLLGPG